MQRKRKTRLYRGRRLGEGGLETVRSLDELELIPTHRNQRIILSLSCPFIVRHTKGIKFAENSYNLTHLNRKLKKSPSV